MKYMFKILLTMFMISWMIAGCIIDDGGGSSTLPGQISSAKAITDFNFTDLSVIGVVDESAKTISVTVPFGTGVTALTATFVTTGDAVNVGSTTQVSGTTDNDFTSPVTYTVTAADTTTVDYIVTVTVELNPNKAITVFSFADLSAIGVIDEGAKSIAVEVPNATDVTALVATFTSTGVLVEVGTTAQVSGTTDNNFSSSVVYKVTAADGGTENYIVTVTEAAADAKAITSFYFTSPAAFAVIDEGAKIITVDMPNGTDLTALVASFVTTSGASVKIVATPQVSGTTVNDFSSSVIYIVVAADTSEQSYVVTVNVAATDVKALTAFSFEGLFPTAVGVINEGAKTITVDVPFGTGVTALTATFSTTGSSVKVGSTAQVSGITDNNFSSPLTYTVTAADASTLDYIITVTVLGDVTAPSGYSVVIDQASLNAANETAMSFTFTGAEVDATYSYSIEDTDGVSTAVTGTGSITTSGQVISSVDVSALSDGTLTLSVTLTDAASNEGTAAEDTVALTTNTDAVAAAKSDLLFTTIANGNSAIDNVKTNLSLAATGTNSTAISWASDNAGAVAINGTVNRPTFLEGNATATLTATITRGNITDTDEFIITVIKQDGLPNSITPVDAAIDIVKSSDIVIRFNGALNGTIGTVSLATPAITYTNGDNCVITLSTDSSTNDIITINPTDDFAGVKYSDITVTGFEDSDGVAIPTYNDAAYYFTAVDPIDLYLPFNGNFLDEGKDTLVTGEIGGVALTTDRHGVADRAYDFDGVDDRIYVAGNIGPTLFQQYTVSAWIYVDTFKDNAGIVSRYHNVDSSAYTLRILANGGLNSTYIQTPAGTLAATGTWYHVTFVGINNQDSTRTVKFYVNGVKIHEDTAIGYTGVNITDINIGTDWLTVTNDRYFDGKIDDLRIYEYDLTDSQVKAIYDVEKP